MPSIRHTALFVALAALGACGTPQSLNLEPSVRTLEAQAKCDTIRLSRGQTLTLSLPSNPTTGFRWQLFDAAPSVLTALGPEVYRTPEEAGMVGSGGLSTWRFQAAQAGQGRLLLQYQRPWEQGVAPALTYDCPVHVN